MFNKKLYKFMINGKRYYTCAYSADQAWFFIQWRIENGNP